MDERTSPTSLTLSFLKDQHHPTATLSTLALFKRAHTRPQLCGTRTHPDYNQYFTSCQL